MHRLSKVKRKFLEEAIHLYVHIDCCLVLLTKDFSFLVSKITIFNIRIKIIIANIIQEIVEFKMKL